MAKKQAIALTEAVAANPEAAALAGEVEGGLKGAEDAVLKAVEDVAAVAADVVVPAVKRWLVELQYSKPMEVVALTAEHAWEIFKQAHGILASDWEHKVTEVLHKA